MKNTENKKYQLSSSRRDSKAGYPSWLNDAVFYQIYPQSFFDTNSDGIGDIPGIIQKLDYLQWLGINAVWINPCFVSPFQDAGYDVSDYYRIAPRYGTNRDLYRLCREAHRRGIRVCLDLVAGHTSVEHPWFKASSRQKKTRYLDRYIWTNTKTSDSESTLSLVNNQSGRHDYYLANCFEFQPALNYGFAKQKQSWQQPVDAPGPLENRQELLKIMDFWLSHGVDGFRVDMAFSLVKLDPDRKETIKLWQDIGQKIHAKYPEMVLISEWGNPEESIAAGFDLDFMLHFGVSGYPDLMLNKDCFFRRSGIGIKKYLDSYQNMAAKTKGKGLISIPSANHDIKRPRSDGRTIDDLKVIFTFLLTWTGVPFIYYGDEIGMRYIPDLASKEGGLDRTGSRTPMQWDGGPQAGFSSADEREFYLPPDPHKNRPNLKKQAGDDGSLLNHIRNLITLRKQHHALQADSVLIPLQVETDHHHFIYLRQDTDERFLIVINPSSEPSKVILTGLKSDNPECRICHGVKVNIHGENLHVEMTGVSYGVFRI